MAKAPTQFHISTQAAGWIAIPLLLIPLAGCGEKLDVTKYTAVRITTTSGSHLKISPDGSGGYGYGAMGPIMMQFPSGSFDFDTVLRGLHRSATSDRRDPDDTAFWFHEPNKSSFVAQYTSDDALVLGLFERARRVAPSEWASTRWNEAPPIRFKQ